MDYSVDSEEAFIKCMHEFRLMRVEILEKEYYAAHSDGGNHRLRNERYHDIMELLGEKKWMMFEFMDRDADCTNPNPDYFYNKGFQDCFAFLQTLKAVAGQNVSLDKAIFYGQSENFEGRPEPERFYETLE